MLTNETVCKVLPFIDTEKVSKRPKRKDLHCQTIHAKTFNLINCYPCLSNT